MTVQLLFRRVLLRTQIKQISCDLKKKEGAISALNGKTPKSVDRLHNLAVISHPLKAMSMYT